MKFDKLKKWSKFHKTCLCSLTTYIKKEPKFFLYTVFLFLLMGVIFAKFYTFVQSFFPGTEPEIALFVGEKGALTLFLYLILFYMIIPFLLYSLFKYGIVGSMRNVVKKSPFTLSRFWAFLRLNALLFLSLFILLFLFSLFALFAKPEYMYLLRIFLIVFFIFSYLLMNLAQVLFFSKEKLGVIAIWKLSFSSLAHAFSKYVGIILFSSCILLFFSALVFLLGYILTIFSPENPASQFTLALRFNQGVDILSFVIIFILLLFNLLYLTALFSDKKK